MNLNPFTIARRGVTFRSAVGLSALLHTAVILAVLASAASTAPRLLTGDGGGLIHVTLQSESPAPAGIKAPAPARQAAVHPPREIAMKPVPATQAVRDDSSLRQEKRFELASLSVPEVISDASKSGRSAEAGTSARGNADADGQARGGGQGKTGSPGEGRGDSGLDCRSEIPGKFPAELSRVCPRERLPRPGSPVGRGPCRRTRGRGAHQQILRAQPPRPIRTRCRPVLEVRTGQADGGPGEHVGRRAGPFRPERLSGAADTTAGIDPEYPPSARILSILYFPTDWRRMPWV